MGARTYSVIDPSNTAVVTTAETVVATLPGVTTDRPGQTVRLRGSVQFLTGAGTTALTLRIRRDSLTGAQVGEANPVQIEAAAGSREDHDYYVEDAVAGEVAGQAYVLTVQATAATGNGSCDRATLEAAID